MTETLTLRFDVTGFDPAELAGIDGDWLGAVIMRKEYVEGLTGTSVAHFVASGTEEDGRGYLAAERITGALDDGRRGSFTVHHGALSSPDDGSAFAHIVPGTGTDRERLNARVSFRARLETGPLRARHGLVKLFDWRAATEGCGCARYVGVDGC